MNSRHATPHHTTTKIERSCAHIHTREFLGTPSKVPIIQSGGFNEITQYHHHHHHHLKRHAHYRQYHHHHRHHYYQQHHHTYSGSIIIIILITTNTSTAPSSFIPFNTYTAILPAINSNIHDQHTIHRVPPCLFYTYFMKSPSQGYSYAITITTTTPSPTTTTTSTTTNHSHHHHTIITAYCCLSARTHPSPRQSPTHHHRQHIITPT